MANKTIQEEKALMPVNPESLIAQAIEKNVPIEIMERLLAMRRELKEEWSREEYFKALALFQRFCPAIPKGKKVYDKHGKYRYSYAPLDVIVEAVKDIAEQYGFSHTTKTKQDNKSVTATCHAHHKAGHSESSEFTIPIDFDAYMNAPQKVGTARSYAKRYAFCDVFGIMTTDEDNDANGFGDKPGTKTDKKNDDNGKKKTETQNNNMDQYSIRDYYEWAVIRLGALLDEKLIGQDGYDVELFELKRLLKDNKNEPMWEEYLKLRKKYKNYLDDQKTKTAETVWELCIKKIDQMFDEKLIDETRQNNEIDYLQSKKGNAAELKSRLAILETEHKKLKDMKETTRILKEEASQVDIF